MLQNNSSTINASLKRGCVKIEKVRFAQKSFKSIKILQIDNQHLDLWDFHYENLLSLCKAQTSLALLSLTRRFVAQRATKF